MGDEIERATKKQKKNHTTKEKKKKKKKKTTLKSGIWKTKKKRRTEKSNILEHETGGQHTGGKNRALDRGDGNQEDIIVEKAKKSRSWISRETMGYMKERSRKDMSKTGPPKPDERKSRGR